MSTSHIPRRLTSVKGFDAQSQPQTHASVAPSAPLPTPPLLGAGGPPNPPVSDGPTVGAHRNAPASAPSPGGGPKTPQGKAVSARNATTHGLFCRQTVLPHLGEDPDGYKKVLDTLTEQFDPRTLMERQYLELWAEASWKLRRLARWEAQLWEQEGLDEDDRLLRLERVMRLQTTLRRQLDKAVRMLSRDIPELQTHYARRIVLATRHLTEADCREDAGVAYAVEEAVQAEILDAPNLRTQGETWLDTPVPPEASPSSPPAADKNCQNEPLPPIGEPAPPIAPSLSPIPMGERCPMRADRGLPWGPSTPNLEYN